MTTRTWRREKSRRAERTANDGGERRWRVVEKECVKKI